MGIIPQEAQFESVLLKRYYRIVGEKAEHWVNGAWQDAAPMTAAQVNEYVRTKTFGFSVVTSTTLPHPTAINLAEEAWVVQYLDNPNQFGGLDPVTGTHPVRVTAFHAYRFPDETSALQYCVGKKNLLVACKLKLQAQVRD